MLYKKTNEIETMVKGDIFSTLHLALHVTGRQMLDLHWDTYTFQKKRWN